jgi:hypothetical protein
MQESLGSAAVKWVSIGCSSNLTYKRHLCVRVCVFVWAQDVVRLSAWQMTLIVKLSRRTNW